MTNAISTDCTAWTEFESRLRAYIRKRVDNAFVDDVSGDVMLRLVQHRKDFEAAKNPTAWMLRVAANAIADHYRRREIEQRALAQMQDTTEQEACSYGNVEYEIVSAEVADCMLPLIRRLPAPYAEALILTEIEGLAQNVAAERVGLSHSGMKTRVQRGRAKLKAALFRCCDFEVNRDGTVRDYRKKGDGEHKS